MTNPRGGVSLSALALASQMTELDLARLLKTPHPDHKDMTLADMALPSALAAAYSYADALAVELARQLSDQYGLPLASALHFVGYTGAVEHYAVADKRYSPERKGDYDFWVAVTGARNSWGDDARGSLSVTGFGVSEFWTTMHFHGTFDQVTAQIKSQILRDGIDYSDSDFARLFMANVSAADRRLQKRIGDLGLTDFGLE